MQVFGLVEIDNNMKGPRGPFFWGVLRGDVGGREEGAACGPARNLGLLLQKPTAFAQAVH